MGDGRSGATVAPDGTLDWFCTGGISSRPDLWRLIDPAGPAVRVGPVRDTAAAARRLPPATLAYRPGTNVVDTVASAGGGRVVSVTDFVAWPGPSVDPPGGIVRLVRALAGPVEVEVEVMAGPDRRPGGSSRAVAPTPTGLDLDGLAVNCPARFEPAPLDRDTPRWRAVARLEAGEELVVSVGAGPLTPTGAHRLREATEAAWRSWLRPVGYAGPYRGALERALLALRSLTGPGGAPAGAGTTSLPRRVGSERNADARWVKLAAVAAAARALAACGLAEDAAAAEGWLREMAATAHLPWPAWLDGDGQPVPEAEQLPVEGWRRSAPVWLGRPGVSPVGLVGEVAAALGASASGPGGRRDDPGPLSAALDALGAAADRDCDRWREPDPGPWEMAGPGRPHCAGRLWLWSGLGRLAREARRTNPLDLRAAVWQAEAAELLPWIEGAAASAGGWLPLAPGLDEPDAALLAAAWAGPWPSDHPVVAATFDRVLERLGSGPFVYRYSDRVDDGRAGPDHPDLECSLLAVRALAAGRRWEEGHARMEAITGFLAAAGPGLAAETVDPVSGQLFGNLPASGASLALVDAALALDAGPR
jgi:hypothetical protein